MTSVIGKIYIEYTDGSKFRREEIQGGSDGFMLTDDEGNRIWVWIKKKKELLGSSALVEVEDFRDEHRPVESRHRPTWLKKER